MFEVVERSLAALTRKNRAIYGLVAVGLVAVLDAVSGEEIAFSLFYLFPVAAVAWHGRWLETLAVAGAAAAGWFAADLGHMYGHPLILYWNSFVRLVIFVLLGGLLRWSREKNEELRGLATTDPLTGLANRTRLFQLAEIEIERSRRYGHPITLAYLDLDDFKAVNDQQGHAAGDQVLRQVGLTLKQNLRTVDVAARLGGDEFVVLLPETGLEAARAALVKVQSQFSADVAGYSPGVALSIGAVTFTRPEAEFQPMITAADNLMYAVKRQGKNGLLQDIR